MPIYAAPHDEHQHDQQHEHHGQKRHHQGDGAFGPWLGFLRVADDVREVRPRGESGTTIGPGPDSGLAGVWPLGDSVEVADDSWGKSGPASSHSGQSSRHTSVSALTRPSVSQRCMTSPEAGPYCPPLGGLTYHTAAGASLIGSPTEAASTVATPPDPSGRPGLGVLITAGLLSGKRVTAGVEPDSSGRSCGRLLGFRWRGECGNEHRNADRCPVYRPEIP